MSELPSFRAALLKVGELNLSGLSAETILNYPRAEPMPSAAYEKAQQILARVPPSVEKTARLRPDRMEPGYDTFFGRKKKKNSKTPEQVKSLGAHLIGGAGAAKFLHDWVDSGRQAYAKAYAPNPKAKFVTISSGAALGGAEYLRKRLKKRRAEQLAK